MLLLGEGDGKMIDFGIPPLPGVGDPAVAVKPLRSVAKATSVKGNALRLRPLNSGRPDRPSCDFRAR